VPRGFWCARDSDQGSWDGVPGCGDADGVGGSCPGIRVFMWVLGRGTGEGDEEEKWGAGQEPCLLQGKGLCCHGIFIPLWETETCDTPIKSAMARQDGQPDPPGRAATGSVSPGGIHSTAGALDTPSDLPVRAPQPCIGWGRYHQPQIPPAPWQPGHHPAVPQPQHVPLGRERG